MLRIVPDNLQIVSRQHGFTLLELLVVLAILTAVASMAISTTDNSLNQQRFEDTQRKIKRIRHAILGYPERTVNGGPEISGFVADVGRLPDCLAELFAREQSATCDPNLDADDNSATNPHADSPVYGYDATSGLWRGWRGPYIDVIADLDGTRRYRDGWGNHSSNDDDVNFGWVYELSNSTSDPSQAAETLVLRSKGLNNIDDASGDAFEAHYPLNSTGADQLVVKDDFLYHLISGGAAVGHTINVTFYNAALSDSAGVNVCVVMYYVDGTGSIQSITVPNQTIPMILASSSLPQVFTFIPALPSAALKIVYGNLSYSILADGSCSVTTPLGSSKVQVKNLSRRAGLTSDLDWRID